MNKFLKYLVKHHPRISCVLYSMKHSKDPEYISRAMRTDSMVMKCNTLGNENHDKNIYYIEFGDYGDGFFAEYNVLLRYLYYSDRFHMTPVVKFTEKYLYAEDHPVNGTSNPFEYYYEQPGKISVNSALKSRNVFHSEYIHTKLDEIVDNKSSVYGSTDDYIRMMSEIDKKYIRLRPDVKEYIKSQISKVQVDDKTIGIHFRGTDYKRALTNHPVFIDAEEYIFNVNKLLNSGRYDKIFLATDDKDALEKFKTAFSDRLKYFEDVYRASGDTSVAFSSDGRCNHHYMLGLEVMRDMYALANCGALVAGESQVSLAARITKYSLGSCYYDEDILTHGVVKNGNDSNKYYMHERYKY